MFGKHFSDHMLEIEWTEESGWGSPRIGPMRNFSMHPAAKVFHYATEVSRNAGVYIVCQRYLLNLGYFP